MRVKIQAGRSSRRAASQSLSSTTIETLVAAKRLSGGQRQRLCLARTLATKPQALLLDEPCSALDPAATRHIEEHVRDFRRDFPVIIVTHNVAQARRVSDYVLFRYEGALIEAGSADQVFVSPKSELARGFISGQFG